MSRYSRALTGVAYRDAVHAATKTRTPASPGPETAAKDLPWSVTLGVDDTTSAAPTPTRPRPGARPSRTRAPRRAHRQAAGPPHPTTRAAPSVAPRPHRAAAQRRPPQRPPPGARPRPRALTTSWAGDIVIGRGRVWLVVSATADFPHCAPDGASGLSPTTWCRLTRVGPVRLGLKNSGNCCPSVRSGHRYPHE